MMGRRRFHGSSSPIDRSFQMRECKSGEQCAGRLHFYALSDADADTLFELLAERQAARANPQMMTGVWPSKAGDGTHALDDTNPQEPSARRQAIAGES